ncbi:Terminase RNaseH-like domain containing protein [uncultured Caudovirales phage]|uniref:Terminase RNaseH-like domain containing protein n=1 Tax=uncultured Caudovirales phage TaxID=2100421 RepID=A0A6J5MNC2_9CAUD|nr:Terminase RNaseH-like domain containing protein [uncultured Caudovirales phage]
MKFNLKQFYAFCAQLKIETKEQGLRKMDTLLGTQTYVMDEIAKGLDEDIHMFIILKGRQLGITTISLALDLYWQFIHPGWQGTLVSDTEENRDMFRSTLAMYMDGLPKEYKIPLIAHNRNQLVLKNRSRIFYQIAGNKSRLGQGKAITYLHGTETASWGNEEGLASLIASLAETNPNRLYIFESTAQGFNMFHEMYTTAKRARTQRAIFCGWWRNQFYSVGADTDIYKVYWDGKLNVEEKEWTRDIKKMYGVEINSRQMAWWRWKLHEGIKDDSLMYQEFPPTEDYAFVMTGTSFFSNSRCTDAMKISKKIECDYYRYSMGSDFKDTDCIKSTERMATLKVWEEPVDTAYYVIGADPAYGSSDWADRFCIQVFRAYADGLEQVAEFATSELNTYQFAWVIAHLAGAYKNSTLNLEVNGPGQAVINELRNLKRQASMLKGNVGRDLLDVLSHMQNYIWRRNDAMGTLSASIGWVTTTQTKERMLTYMKDYFERGMMAIYSGDTLEEMKTMIRDGGSIEASGRNKDDRVVATALASAAFAEQVQPRLIQMGHTRDLSRKLEPDNSPEGFAVNRNVGDYLKRIGLNENH